MRPSIPSIYFGLSDLQMTPFIKSSQRFRTSLVEGMLFHGNLVIPDAFWFMSEHLCDEVRRGERSLVLAGLMNGWIRPHFREHVGGSFKAGLTVIKEMEIVGLLPSADALADILDHAAQKGERYRYAHWPLRSIGRSFLSEIKRTFDSSEPPMEGEEAERAWHDTEVLRKQCVCEAVCRTKSGSLRRGELFDVVGRRYVGWDREEKVLNAGELLEFCGSGRKKSVLKTYIHWVNQCYQRNQARLFRKSWICSLGEGAQQISAFAQTRCVDTPDFVDVIECECALPPFRLMAAADPQRTLSLRNTDEAKKYFQALADWRKPKSNGDAGHTVLVTLHEYCRKIESEYADILKNRIQDVVRMVLPTRPTGEKKVWLRIAWNGIGQIPKLGMCIYVGKSAWDLFSTYSPEKAEIAKRGLLMIRERTLRIEAIRSRRVEVQLYGDSEVD